MCGLVFLADARRGVDLGEARRSLDVVFARGPDNVGVVASTSMRSGRPAWILGHRRLSIFDPSPRSNQPMSLVRDNRYLLAFNGSIYNFPELRRDLEQVGCKFGTSSDTEVLLAHVARFGLDGLNELNGMFAFVLVDRHRQRATLVRDRLGIKPLYLWQRGSMIAAVSDPRQLRVLSGFEARVQTHALYAFLDEGLMDHEPDRSLLDGVEPLPPGCAIELDLQDTATSPRPQTYWSLATSCSEVTDYDAAVELTRSVVTDAIRIRLRSDVGVGALLSGGIDSSSIVGYASRSGHDLQTFSTCWSHLESDESSYIDAVCSYSGLQNHKVYPSEQDAIDDFEQLIEVQGAPVASLSQYAHYRAAQLANEHDVRVLINGQGADEAFAGYMKYQLFRAQQLWNSREIPKLVSHVALGALRGDRRRFRFALGERYLPRWLVRRSAVLRPPAGYVGRVWKSSTRDVSDVAGHQLGDILNWSLPVLLRYEDRNTMAWSIESRVPFVDHRVMKVGVGLPAEFLVRNGVGKRVLRDAMAEYLPHVVRSRRDKMGFNTPQDVWMRSDLGEYIERLALRDGVFNDLMIAVEPREFARGARGAIGSVGDRNLLFRLGAAASWLRAWNISADSLHDAWASES